MPWRTLLTGALGARARAAVAAIGAELARRTGAGPTLAVGAAGIALFHAYRGDGARAAELLDAAIAALASGVHAPGLHDGFTGVAWAAEHLGAGAEIDEILLDLAARAEACDLIGGLAGFAVYALERGPAGARLLDEIVARLDERAGALADAGVAHGVPGIIAVLGSVPGPRARSLRQRLTAWLAGLRAPAPDGSLYPAIVGGPAGCRAAWCYGDPGIAAALLRAARAADDPALEALALDAGGAAAARPPGTSGVVDAGLCHGAAGLLHIFNRLHQATGDPALAAAARRWAERTLELGAPVADAGFLTGAAGIGLALLAATGDAEPRWDIVLGCDVAPM